MPERTVAEVFPPGEFIKEEIEARGWSQSDLAEILGVNDSVVSALINGKKSVTPDLAKALGAAFETSAQLWMNRESSYRLFHAENTDDVVARKARLYERAPVKELIKRQWIEPSDNITVLEKEGRHLLGGITACSTKIDTVRRGDARPASLVVPRKTTGAPRASCKIFRKVNGASPRRYPEASPDAGGDQECSPCTRGGGHPLLSSGAPYTNPNRRRVPLAG